jgi:hypothetical protein
MKTFDRNEKQRSDYVGALGSTTLTEDHQLARLPEWPSKSIAILVTVGRGPFAIPISAPQRRGDREILDEKRLLGTRVAALREMAIGELPSCPALWAR